MRLGWAGLVNTGAGLARSLQVLRNWPVHPAPASGGERQDRQVPQLIISPVPCCAGDALS